MKRLLALYRDEWKFFHKELVRLFILLCALFVAVMLISLLFFHLQPTAAQRTVRHLIESSAAAAAFQSVRLLICIAWNNLIAAFMALVLGLLPFQVFPMLPLLWNGFLLAAVIHVSRNQSCLALAAGLLPHGLIEIPSFIFAVCLGVQLSRSRARTRKTLLTFDSSGKEAAPLLEFSRAVRSYALIVIPMLILAAVIEIGVTPLIMAMAMR